MKDNRLCSLESSLEIHRKNIDFPKHERNWNPRILRLPLNRRQQELVVTLESSGRQHLSLVHWHGLHDRMAPASPRRDIMAAINRRRVTQEVSKRKLDGAGEKQREIQPSNKLITLKARQITAQLFLPYWDAHDDGHAR